MSSISWVTVVWSMTASASLMLAAIYALAWFRNHAARAHLLFSLTALSVSAFTFCELWMMRSATPGELLAAMRWAQLPLLILLVSMTWFVAAYLRAGRPWLAWTATATPVVFALASFLGTQDTNLSAVAQVRQIPFLGESVTVPSGVPNPLMLFGQFGALVILIFVADASITVWRRGEQRKALLVGGSILGFLFTGLVSSAAVLWGYVNAPIVFSLLLLGLVAVMGYELSTEVLRASQLVRQLQTSETVLRENQATLGARNRQISDLFGRLIAAQESERARIALDLHDDVSQRIAGLSILISRIKHSLRSHPGDPHLLEALSAMQQDTRALAEQIRLFSHDLHPTLLQHAGLGSALRRFCIEFSHIHAIEVACTVDPDIPHLGSETAVGLYRIAQEGLLNVAKHASARHVAVALTPTSGGVQLSIVDDGNGFDLARARVKGGLGLVSIDERARLLSGNVRLETQSRKGTRLTVLIPASHEDPGPVVTH